MHNTFIVGGMTFTLDYHRAILLVTFGHRTLEIPFYAIDELEAGLEVARREVIGEEGDVD